MKPISKIAQSIEPSATLKVDGLYKMMKAQGLDVVGFGAGEPDFGTPENIVEAAHEALRDGQTKYTPAAGIFALREAVADRLGEDCAISYEPSQIVVASGAKHSIFVAMQTVLGPGDEVLLPAPFWSTYAQSVKMAHAIPVVLQTTEESDFKITEQQLEAAVTDRTKMLILCSPSNPTGMLYSATEMEALAQVCAKHDLYIMSDEIYYRLVYDGKQFTSMASLGEDIKNRTIVVNGISKTYAMTGWRIGYTASNAEIARAMESYLSHSTSAPSTISQYAALEALRGPQESVVKMRDIFEQRRDYIVSRIDAMDGVSCRKPDGAFYIMMNIEKLIGRTLGGRIINNSDDFALAFLESGKVAAVSCTDFGCSNYIRLTYAASMDAIEEGMDRLERFIGG